MPPRVRVAKLQCRLVPADSSNTVRVDVPENNDVNLIPNQGKKGE